jgi:hypothetical protein
MSRSRTPAQKAKDAEAAKARRLKAKAASARAAVKREYQLRGQARRQRNYAARNNNSTRTTIAESPMYQPITSFRHEVSQTPIARHGAQNLEPNTAPPRLNESTTLTRKQAFKLEIGRMVEKIGVCTTNAISASNDSLLENASARIGDLLALVLSEEDEGRDQ